MWSYPSLKHELNADPELQSALVRLAIWLFSAVYVGLTALYRRYEVDLGAYTLLFGVYLLLFLGIVVSIRRRPGWQPRRYASLVIDISATTMAIYLTAEPINPFCALYVWIFVSYGTRYGAPFPRIAGQRLLEQDGHRVTTANDGHEALRELAANPYDVVLMDVHMPDLDGMETTRRIRGGEVPARADIPIIGVTASILEDERTTYLHAGMDNVVAKPLDIPVLNEIIRTVTSIPASQPGQPAYGKCPTR